MGAVRSPPPPEGLRAREGESHIQSAVRKRQADVRRMLACVELHRSPYSSGAQFGEGTNPPGN